MIHNPPRILLIDDNRHGLIVRRSVLEERGYVVETAHCGEDGLAKSAASSFDLIVTDYRMPDLSGCEVLRKIREARPHVPIVILSGFAGPLGLTEAETGADAILTKGPSEHDDLVRTVGRLVKRKPGSARGPAGISRRRSA